MFSTFFKLYKIVPNRAKHHIWQCIFVLTEDPLNSKEYLGPNETSMIKLQSQPFAVKIDNHKNFAIFTGKQLEC